MHGKLMDFGGLTTKSAHTHHPVETTAMTSNIAKYQ